MNPASTRSRIIQIQALIPGLETELRSLIASYQSHCKHPHVVGWKSTSVGLIMTAGMVGCPQCGLTICITGSHVARIPAPFHHGSICWVPKDTWEHIFQLPFAQREQFVNMYVFDAPPLPAA